MGTSTPPQAQGYERRPTSSGPKGNRVLGSIVEYGADPLAAMRRRRDEHGDPDIDGTPIEQGRAVFVSMAATHRDEGFFDDPDALRPERWLDELTGELPRGAFFPFGMGPRMCVGANFAMLEATLIVATLTRRGRFEADPGEVGGRPAITLRPDRPITDTLTARAS